MIINFDGKNYIEVKEIEELIEKLKKEFELIEEFERLHIIYLESGEEIKSTYKRIISKIGDLICPFNTK